MAGFHDVLFPVGNNPDAKGGPSYHTTVATSASGFETRNQDWTSARMKWDVSQTINSPASMSAFLSFFRARKGSAYGFRFRDWTDYAVGCNWNGVGYTYSSYQQFATGDGSTTIFQLNKVYPDTVAPETRKITRPVLGTVNIYINGVLQASGLSINFTTGLVTFSTAPGSGVAIQWAGVFDVPVRFEADEMSITANTLYTGNWGSINLIEIRE